MRRLHSPRKQCCTACGIGYLSRRGGHCPTCRLARARETARRHSQAKRDESRMEPVRYWVEAKCPKCGMLHRTPVEIVPNVLPRLYCPQHEVYRTKSEYYSEYRVGGL